MADCDSFSGPVQNTPEERTVEHCAKVLARVAEIAVAMQKAASIPLPMPRSLVEDWANELMKLTGPR